VKKQTVTRHRPTLTEDSYGNQSATSWTSTTIQAMWVGSARSSEIIDGRQTLVTQKRAAFDPGTDIEETDELTASGHRYRITGVERQNRPTDPDKEWLVTAALERAD
jgi:hypothetical protein